MDPAFTYFAHYEVEYRRQEMSTKRRRTGWPRNDEAPRRRRRVRVT